MRHLLHLFQPSRNWLLCLALLPPVALSAPTEPSPHHAFKLALEATEKRPLEELPGIKRPFATHPLAPYLDYVALRRQLNGHKIDAIQHFLTEQSGLPIASALRNEALFALAKQRDWPAFRTLYTQSSNATLRCADLLSRQTSPPSADWQESALELWLVGHSQPAICDDVFSVLREHGALTTDRYLARIEQAANAHNTGLMRYLARSLPTEKKQRIESHVRFLESPSTAETRSWPRDALSQRIALLGLKQLAKGNPGAAEQQLAELETSLTLTPAQQGEVLNQIALWSAASYLPESAERFARVPADAWDERLHEWQFREALARQDEAAALRAIERMPETQRQDLRWRYFDARLRNRQGDASASGLLKPLAQESSYYGFLAAEQLQSPYALCPQDLTVPDALRQNLLAKPGLIRALALHAIDRPGWARREWEALKPQLSDTERRAAVAIAGVEGWHEQGPFTLNRGDDLAYYRLRFPLPYREQLQREAQRYQLDSAWIAALIRAESAWAPDARSHANARGLMQLLPATARMEAQKRRISYPGDTGLYQPETNLSLGIAHLASMLERHEGQPFLATAAYNAGPTPVTRWRTQRPVTEVDLWIETIPYRETRDYVARILAFGVIYDWQLHGRALPIRARALGQTVPDAQRIGFVCPTPIQEAAP